MAQSTEQLFQRGITDSNNGNYAQAENIFKKVIERDSRNANAHNKLGEVQFRQRKYDEANAAYRQAIKINPDLVSAYINLGILLQTQQKFDEAITAYRDALRRKPDDATLYLRLGLTLQTQQKLDEAVQAYKEAIRLRPEYAAAFNLLGYALYGQGKLEEASSKFRQSLNLPNQKGTELSTHTLAHYGLGLILQQQGDLEAAVKEFQSSTTLEPDFAPAKINSREAQRRLLLQRNPQLVVIDESGYLPTEVEEPLVKVLRSTARIIVQNSKDVEPTSIGAGWVVKRQGNTAWIVTNRHVINGSQTKQFSSNIAVEFFSDLPYARRPRYTPTIEHMTDANNSKLDLAVLKVTEIPFDIQPLELFRLDRISRLTPVRVIGHPYTVDQPWTATSGQVTNYNPQKHELTIDATVAEGNSGGPVLNEQKQVIGMVVQIRAAGDFAVDISQPTDVPPSGSSATAGVGLAYHIDVVIEQLRNWRILN